MNQLTVQIPELQDKVNSLSASREFNDLETASSSGLSQVPSQLVSILGPRGMLGRDSCLQSDRRNSFVISGNVFENPHASIDRQQLSLEIPEVVHRPNASPCLRTQEDLQPERMNRERNTQIFAIPTPGSVRKFSTWNPPSQADGAHPQSCMVEQPRNQVPEMHFDKFPNPSTFQCCKTNFKTEACPC